MTDIDEAMDQIFERAELKFTTEGLKRQWLKGFYDKPSKNVFEKAGANVFEEFEQADKISVELKSINNLEPLRKLKSEADKSDLRTYGKDLISDISVKEKERARDIFENVGASGAGLNKIVDVLEKNDYDLSTLKYHAFEIRGKQRIGVWQVGKAGFLANLKSEPTEISEATPNFEFLE